MDGNRRWARERGLPGVEGHRRGLEKLREVAGWAKTAGVKELTVYAFSVENWKRGEDEVRYLMDLFRHALKEGLHDIAQGACVRIIGERSLLAPDIKESIQVLESETAANRDFTLVMAISYGGQQEVLDAFARAREDGVALVTKDDLRRYMWSTGLLDPDLIIRTGGDKRLSNFLTFQSAYSELHFTDTKWPDFSQQEFAGILAGYKTRERRFGA